MLVNQAVQLTVLAAVILWDTRTEGASTTFKLCGRNLSDIMSRVCHAYNSPSWDDPRVVEQPAAVVRRKRQIGIADRCCTYGCTWDELTEYCAVSAPASSESPLESFEGHMIADRSAESGILDGNVAGVLPAVVARQATAGVRREVGRGRSRGYGRVRGRRCWCRRKRRSDRRRSSLMGNMGLIRNVVRAAPVVGTVSPLLTWGRTLNTDLPPIERDRYAYIAVYT